MSAPAPDITYYHDADSLVLLKQDKASARPAVAIRVRHSDSMPLSVYPIAHPHTLRPSVEHGGRGSAYGIFGAFELQRGPYLVIITKVQQAATGPGRAAWWQILDVDFVCLSPSARKGEQLPASRAADEKEYIAMLGDLLRSGAFYYCTGFDATLSCYRAAALLSKGSGSDGSLELGKIFNDEDGAWSPMRADVRFWWNRKHCFDFSTVKEAKGFARPVINGFVTEAGGLSVGNGPRFRMILVSRRGAGRQGTRFNRRGVDSQGEVANFVETEQVLVGEHDGGSVCSLTQIRGSIPLVWQQRPSLKYTPRVMLLKDRSRNNALLAKHFGRISSDYGSVLAVNLIDRKKDQLMLGQAYDEGVQAMGSANVRLEWFDFHKECGQMAWHNLGKLVKAVRADLESYGYFRSTADGKVLYVQRGAVRTNCMDNLDRTNVVQSVFARIAALEAATVGGAERRSAMQDVGLRLAGTPSQSAAGLAGAPRRLVESFLDSPYRDFEKEFKRVWADNADAMSRLYSGTPALKTDFTRTGKRTIAGMLADGRSSVARYFLNNFHDGRTQDAWDLLSGRFSVKDDGMTDEARRLLPAGSNPGARGGGGGGWSAEEGTSPRAGVGAAYGSEADLGSAGGAAGAASASRRGRPRAMSANVFLRRGRHATSTASVLTKLGLFAAGVAALSLVALAFVHVLPAATPDDPAGGGGGAGAESGPADWAMMPFLALGDWFQRVRLAWPVELCERLGWEHAGEATVGVPLSSGARLWAGLGAGAASAFLVMYLVMSKGAFTGALGPALLSRPQLYPEPSLDKRSAHSRESWEQSRKAEVARSKKDAR